MQLNTLGLVHEFLRQTVRPGAVCIDATAGKGRDTALLCRLTGPAGRVLAFDIQPAAVAATEALLAAEGLTAEEIAAVLEQFKKRVRIVAVVDSLKHLQKGGRLPAAVAIVGGALGIKPVLALKDGEIKLVDKGRGRPGALVAMFKQLDALGGIDPRYGYTLLYSDNKQLIAPVHHYMHQNLQLTGGRVAQLGPTIGTHVGPGVVGVVFVAKE